MAFPGSLLNAESVQQGLSALGGTWTSALCNLKSVHNSPGAVFPPVVVLRWDRRNLTLSVHRLVFGQTVMWPCTDLWPFFPTWLSFPQFPFDTTNSNFLMSLKPWTLRTQLNDTTRFYLALSSCTGEWFQAKTHCLVVNKYLIHGMATTFSVILDEVFKASLMLI